MVLANQFSRQDILKHLLSSGIGLVVSIMLVVIASLVAYCSVLVITAAPLTPPTLTTNLTALSGVALIVGVIIAVSIHELGHAWSASIHGISVERFRLATKWHIPVGLVTEFDSEEFWNAPQLYQLQILGAGVLMNSLVVIGSGVFLLSFHPQSIFTAFFSQTAHSLSTLSFITQLALGVFGANLVMAVFNSLPYGNLDGGQVIEILFRWLAEY